MRVGSFFEAYLPLQSALEAILAETWSAFPQLAPNQIAVTWLLHEPPYRTNTGGALSAAEFWQYRPQGASYRGVELMPPAGMVSLFYAVAMHVWLEQGMAQPSAEIARSLTDALTRDNRDAISYLVDVLSGTTSGPELSPGPNESWQQQRNIVNRYFQQLGWPELRAINLNQKLWEYGPYGRERSFLGAHRENQNLLSTEAIARLLHSIVGGVSVSSARSQALMALLQAPDSALPATVWSLQRRSDTVSHDAAYVESDRAHPYQLVVSVHRKRAQEAQQNAEMIAFVRQKAFEAMQQNFPRA